MNYLKLFFRRNLIKSKLTYFNILGLTLGMFTFLFIYFYVFTQRNFDSHLPNSKELYHLQWIVDKNGTNSLYSTTPIPLAETIYDEIPGIDNWCTYCQIFETAVLEKDESDFLNPKVIFATQSLLDMFHHKTISGELKNNLTPGKAVITKSAAEKYLGGVNVVGSQFELLHDKKEPLVLTVEAVIEDIPGNSNVNFEIAASLDDYITLIGDWIKTWSIKPSQSYIALEKGDDVTQIDQQISLLIDKYLNSKNNESQGSVNVLLENIKEKHFKKAFTFQFPNETFVSKTSLQGLLIIGLITLIISWLNYINFLIFQNTKQFREIGVRKIIGSNKLRLIAAMLGDSVLLTSISILLTLGLFVWVSPLLYNVFHLDMENVKINFRLFWIFTLSIFFVGSVIAAIYPILKITAFKPIELIQKKSTNSLSFHKGSVILSIQFVLSIALICSLFSINKQMNFLSKQDWGFTRENIMVLSAPVTSDPNEYNQKMQLFKDEASNIPGIVALSAASSIPGKEMTTAHFGLKNHEETINKYLSLSSDEDYFNVIDAKLLAGENFSKNSDINRHQVIINKELMHKLGFTTPEEAINQPTNWDDRTITGVVDDYHHASLHDNIKPMLFTFGLDRLIHLMIRFENNIENQQVELLEKKWKQVFKNSPFEYSLLETEFELQYKEEQQLSKMVIIFSILSIFITILGLVGSCINTTYKRIKEIGVRKVNGAHILEILAMFNYEFLKWVAIAFIIAIPSAYFAMHKWLENFAYKTNLSWWIFAISGVIAMVIALVTVSLQSLKAATKNPVEALRYE